MMRPYPEYVESGEPWLGPAPSHWSKLALKRFVSLQSGSGITSERIEPFGAYAVYGGNGLRGYCEDFTHDGDYVLIGRQGALCGNINYAEGRFWASEHAIVVTPKRPLATRWLGELLRTMNLNQYSTSAAQPGLASDVISELRIVVPPLDEQRAIAAFLDRETAKIDALVEEQRRLIALLKEKRQAVISHAVTKGLDPTAPMKPSGIEWLGDVPAHWEVAPLKRLTAPGRDIMYGIVLPGPNVEEGVAIVKGGDVKEHRLRLDLLNSTTEEIEAPYARARLKRNDIVYSIRGTIGDAKLVPPELDGANITQDVARISPHSDVDYEWLLYVVASQPVFVQLEQRSLGAAVRGINIFDLKRARIPVPPCKEQKQIAAYLGSDEEKTEAFIREAQRAIGFLQERRSALISAAVTGKIDVRDAVDETTEAA